MRHHPKRVQGEGQKQGQRQSEGGDQPARVAGRAAYRATSRMARPRPSSVIGTMRSSKMRRIRRMVWV